MGDSSHLLTPLQQTLSRSLNGGNLALPMGDGELGNKHRQIKHKSALLLRHATTASYSPAHQL
jgi:hypothetical protein